MTRSFPVALLALLFVTGCDELGLADIVCTPGAVTCLGDGTAEICNERGTAWAPGSCAVGEICVPGTCGESSQCPDACRLKICEPGSKVCDGNHVFVMQCDDTGTEACAVENCASPPLDGVCFEGTDGNAGCISVCSALQKSYLGCEYYAADLDNAFVDCDGVPGGEFCDAAGAQYSVVASNPDPSQTAFVIISQGPLSVPTLDGLCSQALPPSVPPPENFVAASPIPPRGIEIFNLPPRNINATVLQRLAYRVGSNIPITLYQFNPLENVDVFSNDASLLLPTTAVGNNYYIMTRQQLSDELRAFMTVVGIQPEPTEVTIRVTAKTGAGPGIPPLEPGDELTMLVRQYDVLNIETAAEGADLTGTTVQADAPVVVYGGHEAGLAPDSRCDMNTMTCIWDNDIPCGCPMGSPADCNPHEACLDMGICCADHLEQQLFSVDTWGREYVAVRSWKRGGERDVWRLLAAEDGTEVTTDPPFITVPTLGAGEWFEFETDRDFIIRSTKPILVGQFLAGELAPLPGDHPNDAGIGDPAFMLAVPTRQFRDAYVFLAPNKYAQDFISVAAPAGSSVRLGGDELITLPLSEFEVIGMSGWVAMRVPISDGFHTLECPSTCSVMVHGYDQFVSYGYPGGLNLFECENNADCPPERPQCSADNTCETP